MFKSKKLVTAHIVENTVYIAVASFKSKKYIQVDHLDRLPLDEKELAKFVAEKKLKKKQVHLALGGKQIITRVITIPDIPHKELSQALQWEVTKYIPIPPEELIFDYQVLEKFVDTQGAQQRILIVAARKQLVESYCDILAKAGLRPAVVDVEGEILKKLFQTWGQTCTEPMTCCMFLEQKRGIFCFLKGESLFFVHNFEWEQDINARLASEYQRVVTYLQRQFQLNSPVGIYILGPLANQLIETQLQEELGLNVKYMEFSQEQWKIKTNGEEFDLSYTFAVALHLREVG
ncbi:MAG: type IV pilus biogenesis protein PilM [Bacillota bacterium]